MVIIIIIMDLSAKFKQIIYNCLMKFSFLLLLLTTLLAYNLCPTSSPACLPCPNQCSTCSAQSLCNACDIQYYYDANSSSKCNACAQNCLSCSSSSVCLSCMNPYVLSNQTCVLCVIQNALSCSSTVSASACQSGYYLNDNYCYSCLLNCITCSSAYDCSSCSSGYYLNTSIITCNPCPQGCASCNQLTPTQCTSCSKGYLLASNSCTNISCSIANCLYCSNTTTCYQCQRFYYWDGTNCQNGGSVNCEGGAAGPLPTNCINTCSSFAYQLNNTNTQFECKVYSSIYVSSIEYHQNYYYAYNHLQQLNTLANTQSTLTLQSNGEYSFSLTSSLTFSSLPNFYRLQIALKYSSQNPVQLTLSATTPTSSFQAQTHNISSASSPRGVLINSSVVHSNNLMMESTSAIGLVELRIRLWKCSQGCTICLNQQLCQLCDSPNYMLSYNCVANCTAYIHFLPNRTCLTSCPSNYYQITSNSLKFCQGCTSPCSNCINSTFCLSCVSGYFYYSYSCLSACPSTYYPDNSTRVCTSCISPCKTCTSLSTCLSCSQGFWNGTVCTNSCPAGQFGDAVNFICLACGSTCLTCINTALTCTSCPSSLIFYNRQCLSACPSRFYNSSGVCIACVPPCYTCSSSSLCLSCSYNYLLNQSCLSTCPIGYYQNVASLLCSACQSVCKTCDSGTSCTTCKTGCLYSGNCVPSCPTQQFFQQVANSQCSCIQCIFPCNTCTNESTCLTCLQGYYFNGSCLIQCPSGYYSSSLNDTCNQCNKAFNYCLACLQTSCTQCQSNYFLLSGVCMSSCPALYYAQNQQCLLCLAPCKTCISSESCLSCISPYALSGYSCIIQCPSSMIALNINGSLVCKSCTSPCLSCSVTQTNCTYCFYGYYLYNYTCISNCSTLTPTFAYYSQLATLKCQSCAFPCEKCTSQTWCVTCKIGYLNPVTGTCSQCQLGTYAFNSTCFSCPSSCAICYSLTFCTSCTSGFYLFNNTCISNQSVCAVNGYYVSGSVCYLCLQPCSKCWVNSNNCTSCLQGYIFFAPNNCIVDCPSGYYNNNQTCSSCAPECSTCISSSLYCLTCKTNYYLYTANYSCLTACPSGTYLTGTSCSSCQYPCSTCSSEVVCLSCVSGVLIGTQCYSSCLNGYFVNSSLMCQICTSPCLQCTQSSTNCTQCIANYWLMNSTCIISCPSNYFSESQSKQCLKCVGLCSQCSSYVNCTSCISGYILFQSVSNQIGECITSCPVKYFLTTNSCALCSTNCTTCADSMSCLTCIGSLVQYNGQCLTSCPDKMYQLGGICHACSFPCQNCTDAYTCTSCPENYLLVGSSSCVPGPSCPSGYYLASNSPRCDSLCASGFYNLLNATCSNFSCGLQAFMGADMKCYLTCPSGYVANSSLHCVYCSGTCNQGLLFSITTKIIKDSLYLYLIFTQNPLYRLNPSIKLSPYLPFQSINSEDVLVGGFINKTGQRNITFLIPLNSSFGASTLNLSFNSPIQTFGNPLQKSYATMQFEGFDYYPMGLPNMSSFAIIALVCALMGLIKNPYMTDFAQILFFLGLLDTHYPLHLASFLQASSIAHLYNIISVQQEGCIGSGKFMYLTGTGLLSNTLTNWVIIIIVLGVSGFLYLLLWILGRKGNYNKVSQQNIQETLPQQGKQPPCCIVLLESTLSNFKLKWINRVFYFNYSIISLFALTQISDFQTNSTINLLSCAFSVIILPFLVIYPLSMRATKPKYTFLYLRKLLISGAVVLSTQDSIYAVGIISVCNVSTALLLLTYKMEKYRWETRFLAVGEFLQLFTLVCLSFFIMIGEGNQTSAKIGLCWIIVGSAVCIMAIYILQTCLEVVILIYNWAKSTQLRQNWVLNKQQDELESHHSQSVSQSMKDQNRKEPSPSHQNIQTLLIHVQQDKKQEIMGKTYPNKGTKNINADFWVYEQSQKSSEGGQPHATVTLPQNLVRCVNQFSDYNSDKIE